MLEGKRILIVDDAFDVQQLMTFFISKAGADVTCANHGQEGLDCFEKAEADGAPFDLILLDQQMPVMDGPTMARELRNRGKELPIIAVSAFTSPECRILAREAGCNAFVAKPFQRQNLVEMVSLGLTKDSELQHTFNE